MRKTRFDSNGLVNMQGNKDSFISKRWDNVTRKRTEPNKRLDQDFL